MVYTKNRSFEWDPRKNITNKQKHGIAFEEALTAFDDPDAVIRDDSMHSTKEIRFALIGMSDFGVLFIVFTIRSANGLHRIISARSASRKERRIYEEINKRN
ncbi:MAG: BrnT family toxin [Bdellovibrio sp.]|nr:BrnT family toxin [Bdellovibrio sp.]